MKVKQFSLQGARIQNDWQGPQMVKYKNKLHPWKYIVILPVARNPIKISSPNLSQLKPVHEGIRRVLLAQQSNRGGHHGHTAAPVRGDPYARPQNGHGGGDPYGGQSPPGGHSGGGGGGYDSRGPPQAAGGYDGRGPQGGGDPYARGEDPGRRRSVCSRRRRSICTSCPTTLQQLLNLRERMDEFEPRGHFVVLFWISMNRERERCFR